MGVQQYGWGKQSPCEVSRLWEGNCGGGEAKGPFAELWAGTHPELESKLADGSATPLSERLPSVVSSAFEKAFPSCRDGHLPFLAKVLSVRRPLSLQAHPDKELAERLHSSKPHLFKDSNHKPEMALAITPFRLLSGLVPVHHLRSSLHSCPELRQMIGNDTASSVESCNSDFESPSAVTEAFQAFAARVAHDRSKAQEMSEKLQQRLSASKSLSCEDELALELLSHFPGDGGAFAAYLLQHLSLQPGQAVYQPVNEPHTYISGDCVEVQATSDNVARAGLTSKTCDADALASMLARRSDSSCVLFGERESDFVVSYKPNDREIATMKVVVPPGNSAELPQLFGPAIVLARSGWGEASDAAKSSNTKQKVSTGSMFLVRDGAHVVLQANSSSSDPLEAYVACAQSSDADDA